MSADDSENAADRVEQAIYEACAFVAEASFAALFQPFAFLAFTGMSLLLCFREL
jgi:hypothetical protein